MTPDLDEAMAHFALKTPLRFGDPVQVAAVELLARIGELGKLAKRGGWKLCPACDGAGYIICDCGEALCVRCNEHWMDACGICEETGIVDDDCEPVSQIVDANSPECRAIVERLRP